MYLGAMTQYDQGLRDGERRREGRGARVGHFEQDCLHLVLTFRALRRCDYHSSDMQTSDQTSHCVRSSIQVVSKP